VGAFFDARSDRVPVALATSGTSGTHRLVVRTTDSWVASFPAFSELTDTTGSSRVWVPGPLSGTMNLFAAVHARASGAVLVGSAAEATHTHLTPAALAAALDDGVRLEDRTVVVAGDRLGPALRDRAASVGARVHHYYGAAELSFVAWGAHADDLRPFPEADVTVRDGEIWVRSPFLCSGYDGPPGPLRRADDGYATVGDLGSLVEGRLRVSGRPDTVTVGGSTVEVGLVEAVLGAAARGEVCVVGMPHETLGRVLAAVLTVAADQPAVRRLAGVELSGAARPRLWFHVELLPVTAAGKVDRGALVSLLSGDAGVPRRLV
jgi:acyl-CoA synthetase (AMP-forming)/AMP-acid ligase II